MVVHCRSWISGLPGAPTLGQKLMCVKSHTVQSTSSLVPITKDLPDRTYKETGTQREKDLENFFLLHFTSVP